MQKKQYFLSRDPRRKKDGSKNPARFQRKNTKETNLHIYSSPSILRAPPPSPSAASSQCPKVFVNGHYRRPPRFARCQTHPSAPCHLPPDLVATTVIHSRSHTPSPIFGISQSPRTLRSVDGSPSCRGSARTRPLLRNLRGSRHDHTSLPPPACQ